MEVEIIIETPTEVLGTQPVLQESFPGFPHKLLLACAHELGIVKRIRLHFVPNVSAYRALRHTSARTTNQECLRTAPLFHKDDTDALGEALAPKWLAQ